jgi:hypothetical protein
MGHQRALLLPLCLAFVAGCQATAQDGMENVSSGTATSYSAPVSNGSWSRSIRTRDTLRQEGIIRDYSGSVLPSQCSHQEAELLGLLEPPLCDEILIESLGTTYRAFLFSKNHHNLVIYHEGHQGCPWWSNEWAATVFDDARHLIARLLEHADVLFLDMPLVATNCGQPIDIGGAIYTGSNHNWFALVDRPKESALAYFFNHISRAIDFLGPRYLEVHMVGRSGGGWATTFYAALDWRIARSVSIAGTLPIELRLPDLDGRDDLGDWEQYGPYVLRLLSYYDLYEAAGGLGLDASRRHVQIYNEYDECCFSGMKGQLASEDYGHKEYLQGVTFIVNPGETLHTIPIDMVIEQLFGP